MSAIFPLVRRWWWLLAVGTAAAAFVGFLVASRLPPAYEAQTRLLVGPVSGSRDTIRAAGEQARTYAEVATAAPLLQGAATSAGLQGSGLGLKSKIAVTASDQILFSKNSSTEIKLDGEEFLIMREEDILGVLEG